MTEATTPRRAWSIDEWRAMYGLGRNATYNFIAKGVLPTVKAGRRRLITSEGDAKFQEHLAAGKVPPTPAKKKNDQD